MFFKRVMITSIFTLLVWIVLTLDYDSSSDVVVSNDIVEFQERELRIQDRHNDDRAKDLMEETYYFAMITAHQKQAEFDLALWVAAEQAQQEERERQDAARRAAEAEASRRRPAAPTVFSGGGVWDALAQCESGGDWTIVSANGMYFGGLQFSLQSWRGVGGTGYPHQHSRAEQIARAERLRAVQGWGAWPGCARSLGLL